MNTPTDLELMTYADGELSEPRCSEVARFLSTAETGSAPADQAGEGRLKLRGMAMVGDLLREHSTRLATEHAADSIADFVMKAVEVESEVDLEGAVEVESALQVDVHGASSKRAAAGKSIRRAVPLANDEPAILRLPQRGSERTREGVASPANDNNRLIYGVSAIAAAAAVALWVWGRNPPPPEASGREPVAREIPSMVAPSPSVAAKANPDSEGATAAEGAAQDEPSVKVAAVDFGTKTGMIYYVPKDTSGSTTTVVWLADD